MSIHRSISESRIFRYIERYQHIQPNAVQYINRPERFLLEPKDVQSFCTLLWAVDNVGNTPKRQGLTTLGVEAVTILQGTAERQVRASGPLLLLGYI